MNGFTLHRFSSLKSTNDTAKDYTDNFSVIIADKQTGGKGRRGKVWQSPKGNLYASIVITDPHISNIGIYPLLASLSLSEALPLPSQIKWPNDVLIGGKKVSGILLEVAENPTRLILGVGVNIDSFPRSNLSYPATSLKAEKCHITINELLSSFLARLAHNLTLSPERIIALWTAKAIGIGKEIKVTLAKDTLLGVFKGLDSQGNLILSITNQEKTDKIITCGEIYF